MNISILIPAWQPEERLVALVRRLIELGVSHILLVDDGSGEQCRDLFDGLAALPQVEVSRHAINLGKGRALKTGFNHLLTHGRDLGGVVTADADGQHLAEDIVRVAAALNEDAAGVILGSRAFDGEVPARSRFGNSVTRYLFWFLTGRRLTDTQSGLRGFSAKLLPELMKLQGERYEYEMNVLAYLCRGGVPIRQLPVTTVYIEQNRASHFNPVFDSMRIYFVLLRFYASSLFAAGIDFIGFSAAFALTGNLAASVCVGRLSSLANFALNRRYVFNSRGAISGPLARYYLLAAGLALCSFASIKALTSLLGWNVFAAKLVTETVLSLASFSLQRIFVFPSREYS